MRISDWSSDVCSSDLPLRLTPVRIRIRQRPRDPAAVPFLAAHRACMAADAGVEIDHQPELDLRWRDRKSVVSGKSVSVRVDLGGRRIIKKKDNRKDITLDLHDDRDITRRGQS